MDSEKQPSVETEPVVIEGPGIESALLITIYLKSALEQIGEQLKSVRSDIKEVIADRDRWKTCAENADKRVKELEREKDHANMVADAAAEKIKELEAARTPNPGLVGTVRDKNALLEYKDSLIAELERKRERYHFEVECLMDSVKELEREKDHANMVADAAAEKIKDLKDESAHAADSEKGGE